jgi:hypothetical protein
LRDRKKILFNKKYGGFTVDGENEKEEEAKSLSIV